MVSLRMIQAFKSTGLPSTERLVAYMLADHHNESTGRCDPSIATLEDETGLTDRAIGQAIKRMETAGHVTVERHAGARSVYRLHPRTSFATEGASPPKELRVTPESASPLPPNDVRDTPERRSPEPERTGIKPEETSAAPVVAANGSHPPAPRKPASGDHHEFIRLWEAAFLARFKCGYKFEKAKDGAAVKSLLSTKTTKEDLIVIAVKAWKRIGQDGDFNFKQASTISGFNSRFNQIRTDFKNSQGSLFPS